MRQPDDLGIGSDAWKLVRRWSAGQTVPAAELGAVLRRYADRIEPQSETTLRFDPVAAATRANDADGPSYPAIIEAVHRAVDAAGIAVRPMRPLPTRIAEHQNAHLELRAALDRVRDLAEKWEISPDVIAERSAGRLLLRAVSVSPDPRDAGPVSDTDITDLMCDERFGAALDRLVTSAVAQREQIWGRGVGAWTNSQQTLIAELVTATLAALNGDTDRAAAVQAAAVALHNVECNDRCDGSVIGHVFGQNASLAVAAAEPHLTAPWRAEVERLTTLVGDETVGAGQWDGCDRAEAIRQASMFHAAQMKWLTEHDKRRDERDAARARAVRAEEAVARVRELAAKWQHATEMGSGRPSIVMQAMASAVLAALDEGEELNPARAENADLQAALDRVNALCDSGSVYVMAGVRYLTDEQVRAAASVSSDPQEH